MAFRYLLIFFSVLVFCRGTVVQEDTAGLKGQEVLLPCNVDVFSCGEFHSVKWFRDSQRVFVFSELANLERSEGFLVNRARFVFGSNVSEAGLRISHLRLSDEGMYRCEITYLEINEGCPVVQYVNLTVLAAPEYVEILLEDGRTSAAVRNVSRIGPFNEGTTVTVLCRSGGGRPVPQLEWWNGTHILKGEFISTGEENGAVTGINRLQVALTRYDLGAIWQCRVNSPALSSPLTSNLHIDVHVKPSNIVLSGMEGPVVEGTAIVVYCTASGARPAANIKWFNGSNIMEKSAVETTQLQPEESETSEQEDGTFITRSRLIFTLNRYDNERYITCLASNTVTEDLQEEPLKTSQLLQVHYAPVVAVSPEFITVNETMDVLIFCTYSANPKTLTSVLWFKDDEQLAVNRDKYEGATLDQPALLLKEASRNDSGAYSCKLSNAIGTGQSDNSSYVSVQYAPDVRLSMKPRLPVNELERPNVTLICDVSDGNPSVLLRVRWYLDGELLKELPDCPFNNSQSYSYSDEDFCDINPSRLLLEYVGRSFQGNYSCEGMNEAGWGLRSNEEELIIYYPPDNTTLTIDPDVAVKDAPMTLSCGALNPGQPALTQYRWTRNGHIISEISDEIWNVSQVTMSYHGNYTCTPVNEAGEGETVEIEVDVLAPPSFIERLPPVSGALYNSPEVKLSCRVECFPLCEVHWFRNGLPLEESPMYTITSNAIAENIKINQHQSILSTLSFNMRSWTHAKLDPVIDVANYTCSSTSNGIGGVVSSTTLFRIEHPPENATIDRQRIEVEEGSVGGQLQCLAAAYPEANYYWQYNHQIIGNGPRLNLDYGLNRDKTGEYTCVAHNQHGNSSTKAYVDVVFKPECSITLREVEGKTRLICEVQANPSLVDFTWTTNNTTVTKDIVHMGLQSILTLETTSHPTGIYLCYANNSVGMSTPCEINVEGSSGLLARLGDENIIIIIAVIAAAIVMILVVCIVLLVICRRKRAEDKYHSTAVMEERENPDGGSSLALQPGSQIQPVHKWPLKPGVLVHVNGSHSLTLANAGSVLSSTDSVHQLDQSRSSSVDAHPRTDVNSNHQTSSNSNDNKSRKSRSDAYLTYTGSNPHYESIKEKKRQIVVADINAQSNDSGSESTRSVIRILPAKKSGPPVALQNPVQLQSNEDDIVDSSKAPVPAVPNKDCTSTSRKRKKPESASSAAKPYDAHDGQPDNDKAFYENLPFHGLQTAPNKEHPSRPASQMSHAGSSGYGSARSNTGTEVARGQHGKHRGSLMGSLRHSKPMMDSMSPFRSLRMPRTDPLLEQDGGSCCLQATDTDTLPLRSVAEKHEVPVPAPRFQTLKRHAYQNIPLPAKNKSNNETQNPPKYLTGDKISIDKQLPQQQEQQQCHPTATVQHPAYNRVYNTPSKPIGHYTTQQPNLPPIRSPTTAIQRFDSSPGQAVVYADLSLSRAVPPQTKNDLTPTEYAVLQFMGAGQEVQV